MWDVAILTIRLNSQPNLTFEFYFLFSHYLFEVPSSLWANSRPSKWTLHKSLALRSTVAWSLCSLSFCTLSSDFFFLSAYGLKLSHGLQFSQYYLLCYPNIWPQSRPWLCFNSMDCALGCRPCFFLSISTPVLFLAPLRTLFSVPISCTSPFCYVTNTRTIF